MLSKSVILASLLLFLGTFRAAFSDKFTENISIHKSSQFSYESWLKSSSPSQWSVYFFNIANAHEFDASSHSDVKQLKFQEIGPYVYDEKRWKEDIVFDESGETVKYKELTNYTFNAKLSAPGVKPQDPVTVVNPTFGLARDFLQFVNLTSNVLSKLNTIVLKETVENIGFNGIPDLLGQSLFGPLIRNEDQPTQVNTGKSHIDQVLNYISIGNETRQSVWGPTGTCNDVKGTDGSRFKPNIAKTDILHVFEPIVCRAFKFIHTEGKDSSVKGFPTIRFHVAETDFDLKLPENKCYCLEEKLDDCQSDLFNLRNCGTAKGIINMLASSPYFVYGGDTRKASSINPAKTLNLDNYGSYVDVEPITGLVLASKKRFQLNVQLRREMSDLIPYLKNLHDPLAFVPLVWIEESIELADGDIPALKHLIDQLK